MSIAEKTLKLKQDFDNVYEAGKNDFILAWQNKTLTELVIPGGVTALSEYCFYTIKPLKKITLPEGLTTIGRYSFRGCDVRFCNLPSTLVDIGEHAFAINYEFGYSQNLIFPETLKTIGVSAFAYTRLDQEELVFPASVESIGNLAFGGSALKNPNKRIVFKGTPTSIHSAAFTGAVTTDIYVPWAEGAVANSPWGAVSATIHYNHTEGV